MKSDATSIEILKLYINTVFIEKKMEMQVRYQPLQI